MFNNFNNLIRGYTLSMSLTPLLIVFISTLFAPVFFDKFFFINSFLVFLGVLLVHSCANLLDDIFDIKRELKKGLKLSEINFKSQRKARAILSGKYSLKQAVTIAFIMLLSAFLIGCYFIYLREIPILFFMLFGLFSAVFYPFATKFGLGEIVVGCAFGPFLMNGAYYAITGGYSPYIFSFSLSVGIMTTILLITHSLMEFEHDFAERKKTLPVILKNKYLTVNVISILILLSYAITYFSINRYHFEPISLLPVILSMPCAITLVKSLYDYIEIKDVEFLPKWYMGKMENWEEIKRNNFAYFMYRFYLARNLSIIFNTALALVCFFPAATLTLY